MFVLEVPGYNEKETWVPPWLVKQGSVVAVTSPVLTKHSENSLSLPTAPSYPLQSELLTETNESQVVIRDRGPHYLEN